MRRWRLVRRPALVAVLLLIAGGCSPVEEEGVGGEDATSGRLTADETSVTFRGEFSALDSPQFGGDLEDLRFLGQTFELEVALGDGYWERRRGALHLALRWNDPGRLPHEFSGDFLSLYLLDARGEPVGESSGIPEDISTAQSIDAGELEDETYEVLVVPNRTRMGRSFEVVAFVDRAEGGGNLPDLIPRQPTNFTFSAEGAVRERGNESCLRIEQQAKPGLERCLRFDATISNVGRGAFVAESDITDAVMHREEATRAGIEPEGDTVQIIMDGEEEERRLKTGRWVIDREHAHTHLVDLAAYELRPVSGTNAGEPVLTDAKIGFCPWDLVDERFGRPGSVGRRFPAHNCQVPQEHEPGQRIVRTIGISPGWADIYPAQRSIQYLDATDLDDGVYDVAIRVDPNGWYDEADESNNVAITRIRVSGDEIQCVREPYGCPKHFSGPALR